MLVVFIISFRTERIKYFHFATKTGKIFPFFNTTYRFYQRFGALRRFWRTTTIFSTSFSTRLVFHALHFRNPSVRQEKLVNSEESTGTFGGYRYIMEPGLNTVSSFPTEEDEVEEKLVDNSGSLKISSNIGYAQAQYLSNIVEREYVERLEKALKSKTKLSTNPVDYNKSKNLKSPLRKNNHKIGNTLHPETPETTSAKLATTPVRANRLVHQMQMLGTKSTPNKNDEKTSTVRSNVFV